MECETNSDQSTVSLLVLNNDVLLKIFQNLTFDDCMSLAECCVRLKDIATWKFGKISKFEFNEQGSRNYINRVFHHIGQTLTCLYVLTNIRTEYILSKCKEKCPNIKRLSLKRMYGDVSHCASVCGFPNIELLALEGWDLKNDENFFRPFSNLKFLELSYCQRVHNNTLKNCFRSNANIESVNVIGTIFSHDKTLKLLPKLESVCLVLVNDMQRYEFEFLSKLNRMIKLKLCGGFMHMNCIKALGKNAILQELELFRVGINDSSLVELRSLENLQLLAIDSKSFNYKWNSSFDLPPNIKHLKLEGFEISINQISSMINQLNSLENIFIDSYKIKNDDDIVLKDFGKISRCISDATVLNRNQHSVNVILSHLEYSSEKTIIAGRLQFFWHLKYFAQPDVFCIKFPTCLE